MNKILKVGTGLASAVVALAMAFPVYGFKTNADVAANAGIQYSKLSLGGKVTSANIKDGTITGKDIKGSTIKSGDIKNETIQAEDIEDGTIAAADLAAGTLTAATLADGAVTSAKILDETIASADILDGAIVAADIATGGVATAEILDATIVNADVSATAAIDYSKLNLTGLIVTGDITADTILAVDIAAGGVATSEILDETILSADIFDGTITAADLGADSVSTSELADSAVDTGAIADGAIVNADVNAAAAIAGTKISPDFGSQAVLTTGTVTGLGVYSSGGAFDATIAGTVLHIGESFATGGIILDQATTVDGLLSANGGIAVDGANFTVSGTKGDVVTAGDLTVNGGDVFVTGKATCDDAAGTAGQVCYDSVDGNLYVYDGVGAAWRDMTAGAGGAITLDDAYNTSVGASTVLVDAGDLTLRSNAGATGDIIVDLNSTGDFILQDAGVDVITFSDTGNLTMASGVLDVNATGAITLDGSAASNFTTSAGDLTLQSSAASVNVVGAEADAAAVRLNASNAAGGIDIDAGTGTINMLQTGAIVGNGVIVATTDAGVAISAVGALNGDMTLTVGDDYVANVTGLWDNNVTGDATIDAAGVSIDGTAASNFTVTGAADLTLSSTLGSIVVSGGEAAADAINIDASNAAGGIDIDAGTGTINMLQTGAIVGNGVIVATTDAGVAISAVGALNGDMTLTVGDDYVANVTGLWDNNVTGDATIDAAGVSIDGTAASNFTVTGAADLTLSSTLGSIVVSGGEAAADAINIDASNAAGGIDIDAGTGTINMLQTGAIVGNGVIVATTDAGVAISAVGALNGDMTLTVGDDYVANVTGLWDNNVTGDATIDAAGVSIDGTAASNFTVTGAADLTLSSTLGSIVVSGGEAAADAINIDASNAAGGIDIDAGTGTINMLQTGAIVGNGVIVATTDAGGAISAGGALNGDMTLTVGDDYVANVTGLWDNNVTGDATIDAAGVSIDGTAASNFTVTGAADLTLSSTLGSIVVSGGEAAADAINIDASNAAGGIDIDAGTGTINMLQTGAIVGNGVIVATTDAGVAISAVGALNGDMTLTVGDDYVANVTGLWDNNVTGDATIDAAGVSIDGTAASNFTVTGAADLPLSSALGSIVVSGGEAAADAINIDASNAAGGIDIDAGTGTINMLQTGAIVGNGVIVATTDAGVAISAVGALNGDMTLTVGDDYVANVTGLWDNNVTGDATIDAAAASIFTTSVGDLSLISSAGSVVITGAEDAADAIDINASAGGIDIDATGAAGQDIAITNTGGSVTIEATEAAADAIVLNASVALGGIDIISNNDIDITTTGAAGEDITVANTGGSVNVSSSEDVDDAIVINASAGGMQLLATGALGQDILMTNTGGSIGLSATENVADAINIDATAGGIDIDAVGEAGQDIAITNTGGSVSITATESAVDSIVIESTLGGIDILASGATAEDIDVINTGGSVNITATEAVADAIVLNASVALGGIDITSNADIDITTTGAADEDISITNTGGSVNVSASEAIANAIVINASNAAGGIDIDAGTGTINMLQTGAIVGNGVIVATTDAGAAISAVGALNGDMTLTVGDDYVANVTGLWDNNVTGDATIDAAGVSIDGTAASNFTTSAGDVTVQASAASVNIVGVEAAANAIFLDANNDAAGGIDMDAGTGGVAVDTTGAISFDGAAASNFTTSVGDLSLISSAGSVVITGAEDAADAIDINASAGGIDIDATGAAGQDIVIINNGGSVTIEATEAAADAIVLNASVALGGIDIISNNDIDITTTGADGEDITITNTGGSVNVNASQDA